MAGMLIVFGVDHNDAVAAVVLYQAIGYLVPLVGGGIAYLFLRREFGSDERRARRRGARRRRRSRAARRVTAAV